MKEISELHTTSVVNQSELPLQLVGGHKETLSLNHSFLKVMGWPYCLQCFGSSHSASTTVLWFNPCTFAKSAVCTRSHSSSNLTKMFRKFCTSRTLSRLKFQSTTPRSHHVNPGCKFTNTCIDCTRTTKQNKQVYSLG